MQQAGKVSADNAASVIRAKYYDSESPPSQALEEALHSANRALYQMASKHSHLHGMGTTCTALVLWNDVALSAQVGDSRLYLVRNGEIYLMSEDHSAVMEMVRRGRILPIDARYQEWAREFNSATDSLFNVGGITAPQASRNATDKINRLLSGEEGF